MNSKRRSIPVCGISPMINFPCIVKWVCILILMAGNATGAFAQVFGCTDPLAVNYNPAATVNDGSCQYNPGSVSPVSSAVLDSQLVETSGLIYWNGGLVTHNDNNDTTIYAIDTLAGSILSSVVLTNTKNVDWEEISQDSSYIYMGDIGNNVNGNRTDLRIYRISKQSVLNNQPVVDTIHFSYSDQQNFGNAGSNNTDFDCEAFIVSGDSIFLFTKQWIGNGTKVYRMPKTPGTYSAQPVDSFDVQGLITGATYLENKKLLVLTGYNTLLQPFLYCLYDFTGTPAFFSGNKRKLGISLPFHQVEGIATGNGLKYYITNEYFTQPPFITATQKLHIINLDSYLSDYLDNLGTPVPDFPEKGSIRIFPNPATGNMNIIMDNAIREELFSITDLSGRIVLEGKLSPGENRLDISSIGKGVYSIHIGHLYSGTITVI